MKADELKLPEAAALLTDMMKTSLVRKLAEVQGAAENNAEPVVLAAVSGGVDSMVMLTLLEKLSEPLSFTLRVITVNHNIRPEEETAGDAALVEAYCARLGVPCTVTVLERGEVARTALERGYGTEEAARFLRYQAFAHCADQNGAALVCIAHNRNDRLETVLERFFQGARAGSVSGMKQSRGRYFRPLFDAPRTLIEACERELGIPFRTDATNADNSYYRNRIRNTLMPELDELIPGWDTAVLHGAEKNALIAAALSAHSAAVTWMPAEEAGCAGTGGTADKAVAAFKTDAAAFDALEAAERIEALYQGLSLLGIEKRVPYEMLREAADGEAHVEGAGLIIERKGGSIVMKKAESGVIDGFYCLITEPGRYTLPWGEIVISKAKEQVGKMAFRAENIENGAISGCFCLPLVIRSRQPSDRIRDASGGHKEVSKLFSEWHIPERYDTQLPVFECEEVTGVWGGVFDYPDYFVTPVEDPGESRRK